VNAFEELMKLFEHHTFDLRTRQDMAGYQRDGKPAVFFYVGEVLTEGLRLHGLRSFLSECGVAV
jgi:hypothetical protein